MKVIETHKLTKYYGKSRGIVDVDLSIDHGEIFGFIGPNGAGKSTTIRSLMGLISPSGGSGAIFGLDMVRDSKRIKKRVGYLPGEVEYYDRMSVRELMEYSARFYKVELDRRFQELVEIFGVELKRDISDLSAGNKKKVSILQCLAHKPELLILDEPTNGLDPLMQQRFYDVLNQENERGVTIFFSSHILAEVEKICRRVAIIKEGKIVALEDIGTLRKKHLVRIQVDFGEPVSETDLRIPGSVSVEKRDSGFQILYAGAVNPLLANLNRWKILQGLLEVCLEV